MCLMAAGNNYKMIGEWNIITWNEEKELKIGRVVVRCKQY